MNEITVHDFGVVDPNGDFFELFLETGRAGQSRLEEVTQTERGPRRVVLAAIPVKTWTTISERAVRELREGMGETEREKKIPTLKKGTNRLSPLIGRELAVLFLALTEAGGDGQAEAILHGWRELAREERWWLFAKAAAPGQRTGAGWRLALFHALAETTDSRAAEAETKKKSPGSGLSKARKTPAKRTAQHQPVPNLTATAPKIKKTTAKAVPGN